jgi:hypothetical protein
MYSCVSNRSKRGRSNETITGADIVVLTVKIGAPALLVRPDDFLGWRADTLPRSPADELR